MLDRETNDNQPALQIYHLSDLHFPHERIVNVKYSFGENYDSQIGSQLHEVFEQILQKQTDRAGDPSKLIIVSGDLAKHAAYEELEEAVGFIARVASMFRPVVPDEQVIVVPGNHDVNWKIAGDSKHFSEKFDTFKSRFHDADRKFVLPAFTSTRGKPCKFYPKHGVLVYALNSCLLGGIVKEEIKGSATCWAQPRNHKTNIT